MGVNPTFMHFCNWTPPVKGSEVAIIPITPYVYQPQSTWFSVKLGIDKSTYVTILGLELFQNIFSQMVVWWWFTLIKK